MDDRADGAEGVAEFAFDVAQANRSGCAVKERSGERKNGDGRTLKRDYAARFRQVVRTLFGLALMGAAGEAQVSVQEIVERSVAANDKDFAAEPEFNFIEKDHEGKTTKTFQVTMIDGSPYQRLLASSGKALSPAQEAVELKKEEKTAAERRAQTPEQREKRIADYGKELKSDHEMMSQLSKGFDFRIVGTRKSGQRSVWVLTATPKPSYRPPNMDCEVLRGMRGEMWIDKETYEWAKVTAEVIRPVSIGGLLAEVEPGTRFEIEKAPVTAGIWQITHFSMQSHAKVLHLVKHNSAEEDWFSDFQRISR